MDQCGAESKFACFEFLKAQPLSLLACMSTSPRAAEREYSGKISESFATFTEPKVNTVQDLTPPEQAQLVSTVLNSQQVEPKQRLPAMDGMTLFNANDQLEGLNTCRRGRSRLINVACH